MISSKQVELGKMLFDKLRHQFPEVELTTIRESPENPSHTWVGIVMPEDEDREIEIRELASEISTDILL